MFKNIAQLENTILDLIKSVSVLFKQLKFCAVSNIFYSTTFPSKFIGSAGLSDSLLQTCITNTNKPL